MVEAGWSTAEPGCARCCCCRLGPGVTLGRGNVGLSATAAPAGCWGVANQTCVLVVLCCVEIRQGGVSTPGPLVSAAPTPVMWGFETAKRAGSACVGLYQKQTTPSPKTATACAQEHLSPTCCCSSRPGVTELKLDQPLHNSSVSLGGICSLLPLWRASSARDFGDAEKCSHRCDGTSTKSCEHLCNGGVQGQGCGL